jgi:hypothetical protein
VNQPPPPSSAKSWRERLGLPEQPRPTEKQKRAVSLRVRFVDQTADTEGVMGAAAPAPGNKTRADVRRGFSLAGRGQACVYNEAVKIVYSLPEGEQGKMALNHGLLNKVLIAKKSLAFSCKDEKDSPEYATKKAQFDAAAALVQPLRDKYYGGKSLLEAEPWLQKVHGNVLTQALRDVAKAFKSNFAKLRAQKARGAKKVRPFRVRMHEGPAQAQQPHLRRPRRSDQGDARAAAGPVQRGRGEAVSCWPAAQRAARSPCPPAARAPPVDQAGAAGQVQRPDQQEAAHCRVPDALRRP